MFRLMPIGLVLVFFQLFLFIGNSQAAIDLMMQPNIITEVIYEDFNANDCPVLDGCIGPGRRTKLLRFSETVVNIGDSDLDFGITVNGGSNWILSNCSGGFLNHNMLRARLLADDGTELMTKDISMCFADVFPYDTLPEGIGRTEFRYTCDDRQGMSRGWRYGHRINLSCQWLDISNIANGEYTLSLEVNWNDTINEDGDTNEHANNIVQKRVLITNQATVYIAPSNDAIENAIDIAFGEEGEIGTLLGATLSPTEDTVLSQCLDTYSGMVWYSLEGTGGNLTASVCHPESSLDSVIAVFSSTGDGNDEETIAAGVECLFAQDDSIRCGLLSWLTWESLENTKYYIAVGSFEIPDVYEWRGQFKLTVFEGDMPS